MYMKNRKCEENTPIYCVICNICVRKLYENNSIKVKVEVYHVITCEGINHLKVNCGKFRGMVDTLKHPLKEKNRVG